MNNNLERLTGSLETYVNEKILTRAPLDHDHLGYAKKTDFATVAFSGRYSDLIGLPSSSSSDLNSYATINYVNTAIAEAKLNGSINLDDYVKQEQLETYVQTAELKEVAFSGSYNDLLHKPTIPSIVGLASEAYVKKAIDEARLSGSGGKVDLDNYVKKVELSAVATSGSYNDLTDKPAGLLTEEEITTIINNQFDKLIHDAFNAEY